MAQQSSHTSIHYGSTKSAADVRIEKLYITFATADRAAANVVPANVLMAKGFYGNMQRAKQNQTKNIRMI